MQINITGRHIEVTQALKDAVNKKIQRVENHFDSVVIAHVILSVEKQRHCAEATLHLSGNTIFAEATEENMYAAIDSLTDKLDRQVRRHKSKVKDHHAREVDRSRFV